MLYCFVLLIWITAQATASQLGPSDNGVRLSAHQLNNIVNRDILRPTVPRDDGPVAEPKFVELPLDHGNSSSVTFYGRYWVDDTYYQPGGPVFFVDNGEDSAEGMDVYLRQGGSGSLAKEFNGLLVLWEHRFYGLSMPNMTSEMRFTPDQIAQYMKFHAIEQAMEDIVVFARDFKYGSESTSPGDVPWVFLGGSYPGARAAWMRLRNPAIFHASLASSAPVQLQLNFYQYYRPIEEALDNGGYANCSADIRNASMWIDQVFDSQDDQAVDEFLQKITGPPGSKLWNYFHFDDPSDPAEAWANRRTNLKAAISVIYRDFQYVGMNGWLGYFCDSLQINSEKGKSKTSYRTSKGIFERYSTREALDIYATSMAAIWPEVLTPEDYPPDGYTLADLYDINCVTRQSDCKDIMTQWSWAFQVCSEFGAFQGANTTRPANLLPKIESVEDSLEECKRWFGDAVSNGPTIDPINNRSGGWNMNPSNVLFTDGEIDPWRGLSPNSIDSLSPKRPSTTVIPSSGNTPPGGGNPFLGFVVSGGSHCSDLGLHVGTGISNSSATRFPDGYVPDADVAHQLFKDALKVWLPAFEKHTIPTTSTFVPDGSGGAPSGGASSESGGGAGSGDNDPGEKNSAASFTPWSKWGYATMVLAFTSITLLLR